MALEGTNNFLDNIRAWATRKQEAARVAVEEVAEQIITEAKTLCPVSPTDPQHPLYIGTSGALQRSGSVLPTRIENGFLIVMFGFNTGYALAVNERTWVNHRYPGAVNDQAQAKYLSIPILRWGYKWLAYVAEAVRNA